MFTFFSPNSDYKDALRAFGMLFRPWAWRNGSYVEKVEKKMAGILGVDKVWSFDSGRTALNEALKALGVKEDDEVIVQAFTCVVVVNAIKYLGAKPVFIDVDGYNMDVSLLESKITDKTKVIIVQHTFGIEADTDSILKIAREKDVKVIEDCAHGIWKGIGTRGDAAMYSFGVEKVLSSVRGGILYLKKGTPEINLQKLPMSVILKHLFHPIFFSIGKTFYKTFGKALLFFAKKTGLTARILEQKEKKCKKVEWFPAKFPNALARLAYKQLDLLDDFNKHRKEISAFYSEAIDDDLGGLTLLRYPVRSADRDKIMAKAKRHGIFLGNWYDSVVAPGDTDLEATGYKKGSCPRAEALAEEIFNLPTGREVDERLAKKIIDLLDGYKINRK